MPISSLVCSSQVLQLLFQGHRVPFLSRDLLRHVQYAFIRKYKSTFLIAILKSVLLLCL